MNRSYFRPSIFAMLLLILTGCAGSSSLPHNVSSNIDGNYPHNAYTNPNVNYRGHGYYDEYQHYDPLEPLK